MDVSLDKVIDAVGKFVTRTRGGGANIGAETPLLRDGHVDSFGLVDLIGELEIALAVQLPQGALIPEDFESPQVLFERLRDL